MTKPSFAHALATTLGYEGGYSNDPADPGGETYCGISRRSWPSWVGWARIDAVKAAHPDPTERNEVLAADAALASAVETFYRDTFWNPLQADEWADGALAADAFDAAVNMGRETAVELLQNALGFPQSARDGVVGPKTLAALHNASTGLRARFAALRAIEYGCIATRRPRELPYLVGWLHRALGGLA